MLAKYLPFLDVLVLKGTNFQLGKAHAQGTVYAPRCVPLIMYHGYLTFASDLPYSELTLL